MNTFYNITVWKLKLECGRKFLVLNVIPHVKDCYGTPENPHPTEPKKKIQKCNLLKSDENVY